MIIKVPSFEAFENVNGYATSSLKPTLFPTIRPSCADTTTQSLSNE
jgi:hypothetical protein